MARATRLARLILDPRVVQLFLWRVIRQVEPEGRFLLRNLLLLVQDAEPLEIIRGVRLVKPAGCTALCPSGRGNASDGQEQQQIDRLFHRWQ